MEAISFKDFGVKISADFSLHDIDLDIASGDFVVLTGYTGSGKSTLMRQMKREFVSHDYKGSVKVLGTEVSGMTAEESIKVGYVMQSPREQIVTDKVYHELSFGLENMGLNRDEIRLRLSEIVGYFGIADYVDKCTAELSGGEMQIINLASVMAMRPSVLLLDEPTSQLDSVSAEKFVSLVYRLNRELGITVVIAEHRLEMLDHYDRFIIMDNGTIAYKGTSPEGYIDLPLYMRIGEMMGERIATMSECRALIERRVRGSDIAVSQDEPTRIDSKKVLSIRDLWFRYPHGTKDILKGLDLDVYRGEILAVVGANGVGKSTLMKLISEEYKAYKGTIKTYGNRVVYIAQNPFFLEDSVEHELDVAIDHYVATMKHTKGKKYTADMLADYRAHLMENRDRYVELFALDSIKNTPPNEISGGEKAKLAFTIGCLSSPDVLILDEPTKGLDKVGKDIILDIMAKLKANGHTILLVSHDVDVVSRIADRVMTLFDGQNISICTPRLLFCTNELYTTCARRIARGYIDGVYTEDALIDAINNITKDDINM